MTNERATRDRILDVMFLLGIAGKGIDGLVELLVGLPLLFLRPAQITSLVQLVTAPELREDPHDLIAHLLLHGAASLSADAALFTALYLVVHGLVKVVIVVALIHGARRVHPWAIAVLSAFLAAQVVSLCLDFSVGVLALSLFDCIIIWLTWREWRQHRSLLEVLRATVPWRGSRSKENALAVQQR